MKTIKYLFMAVVAACSLTACMDDGYDEPGADVIAAGNNQITEKNVITVQELLNNQGLCTGGYEQSRSNYNVNEKVRTYKFDRNPKKYYAYGTNGMLNIAYKF